MVLHNLRCEYQARPMGVELAQPRLSWQIEAQGGFRQSAYQIQTAHDENALQRGHAAWDTGRVSSSQSLFVPYNGPTLRSSERVFWRVRVWGEAETVSGEAETVSEWSAPTSWEMGLLHAFDWRGFWIGRSGACLNNHDAPVLPAPLLRRTFSLPDDVLSLPDDVQSARVFVCGLGCFELYINGARVGDHVLDPIATDYETRAGYVTHDVTTLLQSGKNVLGAMLGNGWYNCHTPDAWQFHQASWRDYPKLLLQLEITLQNGETQRIVSDAAWKWAESALRFDGWRNGETLDARQEIPGWNTPGFDDAAWQNVAIVPSPGGVLESQAAPPCRVLETLNARSWRETSPGVWLFDFGVNIAGWARLRASQELGQEITLRYGEKLLASGALDTVHNTDLVRGDFQTDRFSPADEETVYETRFSYHGFQWIEASGLKRAPTPDTLQARVVGSDLPPIGEFSCSNANVNALMELTRRAYQSNFVGVPTDCPHREKNGWTGDAQLACETGLFLFDGTPAYAHWLGNLADVQRPNGQLPCIAPTGGWGFNWGSGPAWDIALLWIPWCAYLYRGDKSLIERHYHAMSRYGNFLQTISPDGIVRYGLGDWCPPPKAATAPGELCTTAVARGCYTLLSRMAALLDKSDEAAHWNACGDTLRQAFRREFLHDGGGVAGDEPTSLGAALFYDLLDENERPLVAQRLREVVRNSEHRANFGILGAQWVPRALAEAGFVEDAYQLFVQPQFPGWTQWLSRGATTLWENWDGTSSRNHIMFGDVCAWMFTYVAGLRPTPNAPGFARFQIAPNVVGDLTHAKARHDSPFGRIEVAWTLEQDALSLKVRVPANAEAELLWPAPWKDEKHEDAPQLLGSGVHHLKRERRRDA